MTNITATGQQELEFRRRWYRAQTDRWREASERGDDDAEWYGATRTHAPEGLRILEALWRNGDLLEFRDATQIWSASQMKWFNGYSGQMFINQLVNSEADPQGLARLLPEVLSPPIDDDQAYHKIRAMAEFVEKIRVGSHPASGHIPFACPSCGGWPITLALLLGRVLPTSLRSPPARHFLPNPQSVMHAMSNWSQSWIPTIAAMRK